MRSRATFIFITCALAFMISLFYRASAAMIAPVLSSDLRLGPDDLGLLGGAFFYCFALIQLPVGLFMDRIGPRKVMIILNSLAVAGALIFASSGSLVHGIIGRSLMGFGMAANLMAPLKIFTKWFSRDKFATISGSVISIGCLGSLATCSPLALLVSILGWRGVFYALAGLNLLLIFCLLIFVRDSPKAHDAENDLQEVGLPWTACFKVLFSNWSYWAISFSMFLRYGAFAAIQTLWAGPFLMLFIGLEPITAGNILLLLNVGYIAGPQVGGILSDRVLRSRKRTVLLAYTIAALATFVLADCRSSSSVYLLGLIFFAIGFFNGFNHVSFAHIRDLMPEKISGSAMTGINFFVMMGGGIFIHGLGLVLEKSSGFASPNYKLAFLICFGAFILSVIFYSTAREPARKSIMP